MGMIDEDKDIFWVVVGNDVFLINCINDIFIREGFKYKIFCFFEYFMIIDYMEVSLVEWNRCF